MGTLGTARQPGTIAIGTSRARSADDMKDTGSIPPEVHIACFAIAGFVVSIAYSVDWKQVFG
jgi:hypothetical protein